MKILVLRPAGPVTMSTQPPEEKYGEPTGSPVLQYMSERTAHGVAIFLVFLLRFGKSNWRTSLGRCPSL